MSRNIGAANSRYHNHHLATTDLVHHDLHRNLVTLPIDPELCHEHLPQKISRKACRKFLSIPKEGVLTPSGSPSTKITSCVSSSFTESNKQNLKRFVDSQTTIKQQSKCLFGSAACHLNEFEFKNQALDSFLTRVKATPECQHVAPKQAARVIPVESWKMIRARQREGYF